MKQLLCLFIVFALVLATESRMCAQSNIEETLAAQYYQNGEYAKAAVLYKTLLDKNPENVSYYDQYLNCLVNGKDYATAEKDLKKLAKKKKDPNLLKYEIDFGYVLGLDGKDAERESQFNKIIEGLRADTGQLNIVAAAFERRDFNTYAIKVYEKGQKLLKDDNAFAMELAELYNQTKDYQRMFDKYFQILDQNPYAFEVAENYMQDAIMNDEAYDILRKMLLKRTQAQPENIGYTNLMIWMFEQRKDFNSAYIQAKAIDKRLHLGGQYLISLAPMVVQNRDYDLAQKIYNSVIDLGSEEPNYVTARRGLLDISYTKITEGANYNDTDVNALVDGYHAYLNTYGAVGQENETMALRLAETMALYQKQPQKSIEYLKDFILTPNIEKITVAKAKLALGDYCLLNGQTWDASLYYSQVEKMYEDAPIGNEAKFKNATLFFYTGDFAFAKSDVDILKSATSELIANDAMQLSLLIEENTGLDSTEKPLKLFAEADFLTYKDQFVAAEKKLDSINSQYPGNSLDGNIMMMRAKIAFKKRDYAKALDYYTKVYTTYPTEVLADVSLFKAAELEERYLNEPTKAKDLYEKLILGYKGSVYAVEARARLRRLRGDAVN